MAMAVANRDGRGVGSPRLVLVLHLAAGPFGRTVDVSIGI